MIKISNIVVVLFLGASATAFAQPKVDDYELIEVVGLSDTVNYQFIQNQDLYSEGFNNRAR